MNYGFLLIDKPKGVGSFQVVRVMRKIFNMRRIGYAGTLDPLATGLMIVAIGEATKLLYSLEQTDKIYDVTICLGAVSETYDAEGPIHPYSNVESENGPRVITYDEIFSIIQKDFVGERQQIPPRYSAVKIGGQHAYSMARRGEEVEIPAKKVVFYDIKIRDFDYPFLQCTVHCSPGTYIRSFAHDLGQILGCGAYVQELRRTEIGLYKLQEAVELEALNMQNFHKFLQTPEDFLKNWQQYELTENEYHDLQLGRFIKNRWEKSLTEVASMPILALFEGKTVGLLELWEEGRSVKFAKKFLF